MALKVNLALGRFVKGEDGHTPIVGPNGNWWIEGEDTGIYARGQDGRGAFEIAQENGFTGSEQEYYAALARLGSMAFFTQSEWDSLSLNEQAAVQWAIIYED